jgi:outer membrane receptor protein involved in Fe transport
MIHNFSKSPLSMRLLGSVAALALVATGATAAPQDESTTVIVTAQKREQRLQDVPIVVTTLSAKVLQDAGVRDLKDMQILTPGLTVTSTQNETVTTARIRGVGTVGDNPGLESSVGVVIDGVYRPRNGVSFEDLGEMDRVEILKGPQGTLFGKNTSAGVINVITKKPQFNFGVDGEATVGSYGQRGLAASVTGPIIEDVLAGRLYVAKRERDGYNNVRVASGPRTNLEDVTQNFTTIRGQLLAIPNEKMDVRIIADYSHRDEYCCTAVQLNAGPTTAIINALTAGQGLLSTPNPEDRVTFANRSTRQVIHDSGVAVEANYKLDSGATLTSVTGLRSWETTNAQDIDYTGADILYRNDTGEFGARFKTFSQELRLAGGNDKLNWLVGAFYVDENLDRRDSYNYGSHYESYLGLLLSSGTNPTFVSSLTGLPVGQSFRVGEGARDRYEQSAESWALFTNNSLKLTDRFEVTLGLRYTNETKELKAQYFATDAGAACGLAAQRSALETGAWAGIPETSEPTLVGNMCLPWANFAFANRRTTQSMDDNDLSGTVKAQFHMNDNVMIYASLARGYKAGGFNFDRVQTGITANSSLAFDPETVESKEIGFKSNLFGKKLTLNATYFDQEFTDFQLNTFLGTAFTVETIPELTSKGVDIDFYWSTPIKGLSIQGGASYADTKYGTFTAAQLNTPANFPQLSLLPGATMSFAPEWTSSAAVTWSGMMAGLRTSANLTAKYTDEYNTGSDLLPKKVQEAFTLVNGRIAIGAPNRAWTLEVWGQNLTDEVYKQVAFNGPLQGSGFQSTVQTTGSHPGTFYNASLDSISYMTYLGAPKTVGMTLRVKY